MNISRAIVKESKRLNDIFYHDLTTKTNQYIIKPVGSYGNYVTEEVYIISCSKCGTSLIAKDEKNTDWNIEEEICAKCTSSILKDVHQKALNYWKKELKKSKKQLKKKLSRIDKANKRNAGLSRHNFVAPTKYQLGEWPTEDPNRRGEPIELELEPRLVFDADSVTNAEGFIDWSRPMDFTRDEKTGTIVIKPMKTEPVELELDSPSSERLRRMKGVFVNELDGVETVVDRKELLGWSKHFMVSDPNQSGFTIVATLVDDEPAETEWESCYE